MMDTGAPSTVRVGAAGSGDGAGEGAPTLGWGRDWLMARWGAYSRERATVGLAGGWRTFQPVSPAGVAPSDKGAPGPGEARLLASGALVQGIAQASGLVALLVIVTVLARRLSVAELGAYGLVASLAGYLLVLRNSVASSAVRAMASALDREERGRVFSAAAALYAVVGLLTGLLIAGASIAIAGLILEGDLARDARAGGAGLGVVTALGIAASVNLDALRADRLFVRGARHRDRRGGDLFRR